MKKSIFVLLFIFNFLNTYCQDSKKIVTPFLKSGFGYYNESLLIDGNVLSSEFGLKLNTGYLFSIRINSATAINDIAFYSDMPDKSWNLINRYRWFTLNMGHEFLTKNQKHSFIPMMGTYFYTTDINYPMCDDNGELEIRKSTYIDIGFEISVQYLYNFKNGISLGVNASGCIGYLMGPIQFDVFPVIALSIK